MAQARIAVLASGRGTNLQALLDACADPGASAEVCVVLSNRATAGALDRARAAGVPAAAIPTTSDDGSALLVLLDRHAPDVIVLAGYLKLVPQSVVQRYPGRIMNIHPALLPGFGGRGMYGRHVHEAVLAAGVRVSGVTLHLIDEEYDRGWILAQWPVPVRPDDTAETLAQRVLEVEHQLLPRAVLAAAERFGRTGTIVPLSPAGEGFSVGGRPRIDLST